MQEKGWRSILLGEFVTLQRGFDITKKEQEAGPYKVYSSSGPNSTHSKYQVKGPGVIIGRKGTLGTAFYSDEDFWPHDTTLWVKDFHGNDPKFAYHFLKSMRLEQYDCGASNPTLNRNHIHLIPVSVPLVPIQQKIATILSTYDDLIENNFRRIKILEEMAQTLYREWFVKFRFPGHQKVKMVNSPLGKIPEGWGVKNLLDWVDVKYGKTLPKAMMEESAPYLVYGAAKVIGRYKEFNRERPTIITGCRGSCGQVTITRPKSFITNNSFFFDFDNKSFEYGYFLLGNRGLNDCIGGTAQPQITLESLSGIQVIVPSSTTLILFHELCEPFFRQMRVLSEKNDVLYKTRNLLLPKLISGELDVSELDITIPEANA
ncbi:MAG: restriction endonuclease subunit S [Deltaproteobacteria bacterium]|nr:restriction endonuclease subunit S [Deltaproteobacteria bacterium]